MSQADERETGRKRPLFIVVASWLVIGTFVGQLLCQGGFVPLGAAWRWHFSLLGFIGRGLLVLGMFLSLRYFGEQLTEAEQARANAAFTAGGILAILGPLCALALGVSARQGNGRSGGARGLGLAAIVIAGIQLVVAVGVVALFVVTSN